MRGSFKKGSDERFRVKRHKVVGRFAGSHEAHWQAQFAHDGHYDSAFGRAVEFGEHDAAHGRRGLELARLGEGVLASAFVVLFVQGAITLTARPLKKFAQDEELVAESPAVGGALMLGIGLNVLNIKTIHSETYLPALVFAPLFSSAARTWIKKKQHRA